MSVTINGRKATMEEEKQLAIEMWEFVRLCQTDLCTGYDATTLKRKFLKMKRDVGILIAWKDDCILCDHTCSCFDCPLFKDTDCNCGADDSPYDIVEHPDDHQYYEIDEAIDTIISAIHDLEE